MILCGTGPRGGLNITFTELSIADLEDPEALLLKSFFTPSDVSQATGRAYLARLDRPEADAYAVAVEVMASMSQSPGAKEGMASFLEKRRPVWSD